MFLEIATSVFILCVVLVFYLYLRLKEERGKKTTWEEIAASQGPKTFIDLEKLNLKCPTIIDVMKMRAKESPDRVVYIWLNSKGEEIHRLTFRELWNVVSNLGVEIKKRVGVGNCAMLIIAPSLEYNVAFLACVFGGVIPVPVYPPKDYKKQIGSVGLVAQDCDAKWIISTKLIYTYIQGASLLLGNFNPRKFHWFNVAAVCDLKQKYKKPAKKKHQHHPNPSDLAYLQYTSGSTSRPKGVKISHQNYMRSLYLTLVDFHPYYKDGRTTYCTVVGWIPSYHDTGLILFVMSPVYCGYLAVLFSPFSFLANPGMWIEVMHRYNCTMSVSPNFGYDLTVKRTSEDFAKKYPLPSSCRLSCGAEPIQSRTMTEFGKKFGVKNFSCGYGLAEFTLTASMSKESVLTIGRFERGKFENGIVEQVGEEYSDAVELVACGKLFHKYGLEYALVDDNLCEVKDEYTVGELLMDDESKALGYLGKEEETNKIFNVAYKKRSNGEMSKPRFLRTGDLCFVCDGDLYICGRIKDVVIIRGRNLYPHDIEKVVSEAHEWCAPSASIAFSVSNYAGVDVEQLVIVSEVKEQYEKEDLEKVSKSIKREVADNFGVIPNYVLLIAYHTLTRTSSHKVARNPCKKKFLEGSLEAIHKRYYSDD